MITLINDNWTFSEYSLDGKINNEDKKTNLLEPEQFFDLAEKLTYTHIELPHDWMIGHTKELYKNSVGFYKKEIIFSEDIFDRYIALAFEGVYMNCGVWVNNQLAGKWKYGYSNFEFDISSLVKAGKNEILVIAVYQNCNTRWYSGAGIFRDVNLINSPATHLVTDGTYFVAKKNDSDKNLWQIKLSTEVAENCQGSKIQFFLNDSKTNSNFFSSPLIQLENTNPKNNQQVQLLQFEYTVENPKIWDIESPDFYILKTQLFDDNNNLLDETNQHCGFKTIEFTSDKGFFLNGRHVKINGACHHHDQGALGSAFHKEALRRQFQKLKDMGVNAVRCSHNPPPRAWMDLADEMGLMIDDEAFDMWERPKTDFDYGNYFNSCWEKDVTNWVRKDRNHPSLIMWSIGNEIYDTHIGNGYEITKKLYDCVVKNDPERVAPITIASNYMMTEGAQNCAGLIDTVGYNYLERLYKEHHNKYPDWKIYGSETGSTVQSRGIYHFPESLKLVTFSDGQCSTLGNCTTPWGAPNSQTIITWERDCKFSAGQFIWTGWDYIGEPTPYHTKSSYFGQIDTAGFPKDTFWLYKSEWGGKNMAPFVHLLPYWDWNEGQIIDVKAYSNAAAIELFFNGKSLGLQKIDHEKSLEPFGRWQLEYHKGEIKALAYDENGKVVAEDMKKSFGDPARILLEPEAGNYGKLHFIDIMTCDKDGTLVENARNYITLRVTGDAKLIGMDNGDSTDYEEYQSADGITHTRKLFSNRLVAIIKENSNSKGFTVHAASKELPDFAIRFQKGKWETCQPDNSLKPQKDYIPSRKIEIIAEGNTSLNQTNKEIKVTCKVLPENSSSKEINWNPVLKECVASNFIIVCDKQGEGSGTETAIIRANGDGECILRCTATNGTKLDEVLSDLNFCVSGFGNANQDAYTLIEACRCDGWDESKGKPPICLESGISTRTTGPNWVSFDKVDFGKDGSDSIHIPIFTFETEVPVEVWDGKPGNGTTYEGSVPPSNGSGKCLGKFTYKHESIYNTYSENNFTLSRRLFGTHTISVVFPHELYFKGFYFDKTPKATAKLSALDADVISGDSFTKTEEAVEKIGNNVSLDFGNMNFEKPTEGKLTICGKSNSDNNTINVKWFSEDGSTRTDVIEFPHTQDYEEKTFEINPVSGNQKVSFVFLPGSNFDFKWFRFN